jgi:hypothetical protein
VTKDRSYTPSVLYRKCDARHVVAARSDALQAEGEGWKVSVVTEDDLLNVLAAADATDPEDLAIHAGIWAELQALSRMSSAGTAGRRSRR